MTEQQITVTKIEPHPISPGWCQVHFQGSHKSYSVADALEQHADYFDRYKDDSAFVVTESTQMLDDMRAAARLLRDHADTADRLADHKASLAIQAFTAPDEDEAVMMESLVARIGDAITRAEVAEARLAALTDAVCHYVGLYHQSTTPQLLLEGLQRALAAAVQPPDSPSDEYDDEIHSQLLPPDSTPPPSVCPTEGDVS